jgi:hypothetical protein
MFFILPSSQKLVQAASQQVNLMQQMGTMPSQQAQQPAQWTGGPYNQATASTSQVPNPPPPPPPQPAPPPTYQYPPPPYFVPPPHHDPSQFHQQQPHLLPYMYPMMQHHHMPMHPSHPSNPHFYHPAQYGHPRLMQNMNPGSNAKSIVGRSEGRAGSPHNEEKRKRSGSPSRDNQFGYMHSPKGSGSEHDNED